MAEFPGGARSPVAVKRLRIELTRTDSPSGPKYMVEYHVTIKYSNGDVDGYTGSLAPWMDKREIDQYRRSIDQWWEFAEQRLGMKEEE